MTGKNSFPGTFLPVKLTDTAIALDSEFSASYLGRGGVYFTMGRYDEALRDLNRSLDLNPSLKDAYITRGNLYTKLAELTNDINIKNEYLRKARDDFEKMYCLR